MFSLVGPIRDSGGLFVVDCRTQLWRTLMRRTILPLLAAVVVPLTLAGCGGGGSGGGGSSDAQVTKDLREALRQHYEYNDSYSGLGTVTYAKGTVTVDTKAWADPSYGSYLYCDWAFKALDSIGDTTPDTHVVVIMDGQTVLTKRGESESCLDASSKAQGG